MHVGWIGFASDDVQDADVAALLRRSSRHHAILGLEESPHHIKHSGLPHRLGLFDIVARERSIRRHQEVAARCWDQRRDDADEIVVHVAGVSKSCR